MTATPGSLFLRQVRKLVAAQENGRLTDRQLLEQFLSRQDESAFTALVRRHGPGVLSLCRSLLHHLQDAEDVFQATFFVLARKASSIRKREALGSWLYGVAQRLAFKVRARTARRSGQELAQASELEAKAADDMSWRELRLVLHEELGRLPEKYRAPLLLCYWEGKTQEEAALQLGCKKGTLKERVHRARELLRGRLARRGVTLSAGLATALLCGRTGTAAEALALAESTTRAALTFAAGNQAVATSVSVAAALAEGGLRAMFLSKLKIVAAVLVTVGLLGTGAGVLTHQVLSAGQANPAGKATPPATDQERLQGTWVLESGLSNGKDAPAGFIGSLQLTFRGKQLTARVGKITKEGTYTLDPSSNPRGIDLTENGRRPLGIYRLEGDKLTLCLDEQGKARPTEFRAEAGTSHTLMVLRRQKADQGKGKEPADATALQLQIQKLKEELLQARDELRRTQAELQELKALAERARDEAEAQRRQAERARALAERELQRAMEAERAARLAAERLRPGAAQKEQLSKSLKQLALAMHDYHDTYKGLPPAAIYSKDGKPLLSWRVALLPFLGEGDLYKEFRLDEPWDSPHNRKLMEKMPKVYAAHGAKVKPGSTFYRVFTGPGTVFEGAKGARMLDITDGTSNTIMIVEAGQAVPWTRPDELPYAAGKPLPKLGGQFQDGFYLALCDGSVRFVRTPINEQTLRALITRNGGEPVDLDKLNK
jgi:RNA polymerase sigma-70 factor (ECF subfamily)